MSSGVILQVLHFEEHWYKERWKLRRRQKISVPATQEIDRSTESWSWERAPRQVESSGPEGGNNVRSDILLEGKVRQCLTMDDGGGWWSLQKQFLWHDGKGNLAMHSSSVSSEGHNRDRPRSHQAQCWRVSYVHSHDLEWGQPAQLCFLWPQSAPWNPWVEMFGIQI